MKRILLFSVCMLAFVPQLFAGVRFGVQATGASVNFEKPLDEIYKQGFGGGAHLDFDFSGGVGGLRFFGDYILFSPDLDKFKSLLVQSGGGTAADYKLEGGDLTMINFGANLKLGTPPKGFSVYATGGAGGTALSLSKFKVTYGGSTQESEPVKTETKFSANAGAGVELNLGIILYLEAKYTWIFTEGKTSTFIPVSIGVTF